jgi:hypothetical protein
VKIAKRFPHALFEEHPFPIWSSDFGLGLALRPEQGKRMHGISSQWRIGGLIKFT